MHIITYEHQFSIINSSSFLGKQYTNSSSFSTSKWVDFSYPSTPGSKVHRCDMQSWPQGFPPRTIEGLLRPVMLWIDQCLISWFFLVFDEMTRLCQTKKVLISEIIAAKLRYVERPHSPLTQGLCPQRFRMRSHLPRPGTRQPQRHGGFPKTPDTILAFAAIPQKFKLEAESDRMLKEEHSPILHGWIPITGVSCLAPESLKIP